jgi:hypothetical protein
MSPMPWRPPSRVIDLDASGPSRDLAPGSAAARVAAGLATEPGAVLVRSSPRARAILAALPPRVPAVAVVPDMAQLMRDAAERGAVRTVRERLAGGGLGAWWRVAITGLRHLRFLAAQDFTGIVPVLVELERTGLGAASLQAVALAAPLTDLLLAAAHVDCLTHFLHFVRDHVGTPAGFETQNLGHLLRRLAACGTVADFVIGPLNPRGHHMKPSGRIVREAVRAASIPVLASEVTAGGTVSPARGAAHARAHGAAAVVLTLDELADADRPPAPAG